MGCDFLITIIIVMVMMMNNGTATSVPTHKPTKRPIRAPTKPPSRFPPFEPFTRRPTHKPTHKPTRRPTCRPEMGITKWPTRRPISIPTHYPSRRPTTIPTRQPTRRPTCRREKRPTKRPLTVPTHHPTKWPTRSPSHKPLKVPTHQPTTNSPTYKPIKVPTHHPTKWPTKQPTHKPLLVPTHQPTTSSPTHKPTNIPTHPPTSNPSNSPTNKPLKVPTRQPTKWPTKQPTHKPLLVPTHRPTIKSPTHKPTNIPTHPPMQNPSKSPTNKITNIPTHPPTSHPSNSPTNKPLKTPTQLLTKIPTQSPSSKPTTHAPMKNPTKPPTHNPIITTPSKFPSHFPTKVPTHAPIHNPTTKNPTNNPASHPYPKCHVTKLFPGSYGFSAQFSDLTHTMVGWFGPATSNEEVSYTDQYGGVYGYLGDFPNSMGVNAVRVKLEEAIVDVRHGYSSSWLLTRSGWKGVGQNKNGELTSAAMIHVKPFAGDFLAKNLVSLDIDATQIVDVYLKDKTTFVRAINPATGKIGIKSVGLNEWGMAGWGVPDATVTGIGSQLPWLSLCFDTENVKSVATTSKSACFLGATSGTMRCVGHSDYTGVGMGHTTAFTLGDSISTIGCHLPLVTFAPAVPPVSSIGSSNSVTCAIHTNQKLSCFGSTSFGEIGQPPFSQVGAANCQVTSSCLQNLGYVNIGPSGTLVKAFVGNFYSAYVLGTDDLIYMLGFQIFNKALVGMTQDSMGANMPVFPVHQSQMISFIPGPVAGWCYVNMTRHVICADEKAAIGVESHTDVYVGQGDIPPAVIDLVCTTTIPYPTTKPTSSPLLLGQRSPTIKPSIETSTPAPSSITTPTTTTCGVTDVAATELGMYAITTSGKLYVWGYGANVLPTFSHKDAISTGSYYVGPSQYPLGGTSYSPIRVVPGASWFFIQCSDDQWRAAGTNWRGVLGLAMRNWIQDPWELGDALPIVSLTNIVDLFTGGTNQCGFTFALVWDPSTMTVRTKSWGCNDMNVLGWDTSPRASYGALASETLEHAPFVHWCNNDDNKNNITHVALQWNSACVLFVDGTVKCAGEVGPNYPFKQQIGCALPVMDWGTGLNVVTLSAGSTMSCALLTNTQIKCIGGGDGTSGELGTGMGQNYNTGGELGDKLPYAMIGAGFINLVSTSFAQRSWAVHENGTVIGFGQHSYYNAGGFVGVSDFDIGIVAYMFSPLSSTTYKIVGNVNATCVLGGSNNSSLRCWGASIMSGAGEDWGISQYELANPLLVDLVC